MGFRRRGWTGMVLAILATILLFGTVAAAASGSQVLDDRKGDHPAQVSQPAVDTPSQGSLSGSSKLSFLASLKNWTLGEIHQLKTWWDGLAGKVRTGMAVAGGALGTLLGVGALSVPWRRREDYDVPRGWVWPEPPTGPSDTRLPNADELAFLKWLFGITENGYGPLTQAAVAQLQRSHGIPVDDQVMIGPRTWQAAMDLYQWKITHAVPLPPTPTGDVVPHGDLLAYLQWYLGIQEDGYGPLTKARVAALQQANGIPVDDQVKIGPRTWSVLMGAGILADGNQSGNGLPVVDGVSVERAQATLVSSPGVQASVSPEDIQLVNTLLAGTGYDLSQLGDPSTWQDGEPGVAGFKDPLIINGINYSQLITDDVFTQWDSMTEDQIRGPRRIAWP